MGNRGKGVSKELLPVATNQEPGILKRIENDPLSPYRFSINRPKDGVITRACYRNPVSAQRGCHIVFNNVHYTERVAVPRIGTVT
jgi:hypothetical protein